MTDIAQRLPIMRDQAGHQIRRAQQVHQVLWSTCVSTQVTPSQFALLSAVVEAPGSDQNALSRATSLDTSTVGAVVDRLHKRGWLKATKDGADRRRKLLTVSPEGARNFELIAVRAAAMTDRFVGVLNEEERAELVRLLQKIVEAGE